MLSEHEQRAFREIQQHLIEDSDSHRSFRAKEPTVTRPWQRRFYAGAIGMVALLAVIMVLSGVFGAAVLLIAAAMTLALANDIGTRVQSDAD